MAHPTMDKQQVIITNCPRFGTMRSCRLHVVLVHATHRFPDCIVQFTVCPLYIRTNMLFAHRVLLQKRRTSTQQNKLQTTSSYRLHVRRANGRLFVCGVFCINFPTLILRTRSALGQFRFRLERAMYELHCSKVQKHNQRKSGKPQQSGDGRTLTSPWFLD